MKRNNMKTKFLLGVALLSIGATSLTSCQNNLYSEEELSEVATKIDKYYQEKSEESIYKNYSFVKMMPGNYKKKLETINKSTSLEDFYKSFQEQMDRQISANKASSFFYNDEQFIVFDKCNLGKELYCTPKRSKRSYTWKECNEAAKNFHKDYDNMICSELFTSSNIHKLDRLDRNYTGSYWLANESDVFEGHHCLINSKGIEGYINADDQKNCLRPLCVFVEDEKEHKETLANYKDYFSNIQLTEDDKIDKTKPESITQLLNNCEPYKKMEGLSFYQDIKKDYLNKLSEATLLLDLKNNYNYIRKGLVSNHPSFYIKDTEFRYMSSDENNIYVTPELITKELTWAEANKECESFAKNFEVIESARLFSEAEVTDDDFFIARLQEWWLSDAVETAEGTPSKHKTFNFCMGHGFPIALKLIEKAEDTKQIGFKPLCTIKLN